MRAIDDLPIMMPGLVEFGDIKDGQIFEGNIKCDCLYKKVKTNVEGFDNILKIRNCGRCPTASGKLLSVSDCTPVYL